jgi:hypothetical protein
VGIAHLIDEIIWWAMPTLHVETVAREDRGMAAMEWLGGLVDWAASREVVLWWLFAASLALLLLTPLLVGWLVVRLPRDYFTAHRRRPAPWLERYPSLRPVLLVGKNLLGLVLVLAGLVMLVVPGQGLLTLVVGVILLDFPGKFRLERWLATRPPVWRAINWLRKRAGHQPLERPE